MRLIDAKLLKLERFDDDTKIPPYAILSHTWGSAEVSLQQFEDAYTGDHFTRFQFEQMAGYAKIVMASKQALEDGYAYVWVDTCCIDKTSSAELSEAINSMFRWYKNAKVCYAYLEDIEAGISPPPDSGTVDESIRWNPKKLHIKNRLSEARWFTRGWTLQELIAPLYVRFYTSNWSLIGTKANLLAELEDITGIDADALDGEPPESFSVSKRMSWASNRTTTRTEDIAYSLMGLFEVNMPLLYGEGEKAFVRLQEQILLDDDDQSIFAWSPSASNARPCTLGISVFATSPRDFAHGDDFHSYVPHGEPPTMTNQGVRVDLPV
ncbi:HET-domain-containing protein, partial [Setomelanomma holmii]